MPGLESFAAAAGGPVGLAVTTGLQAALGVAQMVDSMGKNKQAKEMSRSLVTPTYSVQQPILDNVALAESRAAQGMSDASRTAYEGNLNRTLTTSIDAILQGGGNVNSISDLYDSTLDNINNMALLEEELRLKNTQMYMNANEKLADALDTEFQVNEWAPYQDKRQAIAALRGQGAAGMWQGANTVAGAASNYVQANMMRDEINSVYGRGKSTPVPTTSNVGNSVARFGDPLEAVRRVTTLPNTQVPSYISAGPAVPNSPLQPQPINYMLEPYLKFATR